MMPGCEEVRHHFLNSQKMKGPVTFMLCSYNHHHQKNWFYQTVHPYFAVLLCFDNVSSEDIRSSYASSLSTILDNTSYITRRNVETFFGNFFPDSMLCTPPKPEFRISSRPLFAIKTLTQPMKLMRRCSSSSLGIKFKNLSWFTHSMSTATLYNCCHW